MSDRLEIPKDLERKIKIKSGHRCAIPTCKYPRVQIAHIVPWSTVKEHKFENLIALCPNCHDLYDKDKKIDRKSMLIYKQNLGLLNHRYGEFERRILDCFCENKITKMREKPLALATGMKAHFISCSFLKNNDKTYSIARLKAPAVIISLSSAWNDTQAS
jgi:hypothetical protein